VPSNKSDTGPLRIIGYSRVSTDEQAVSGLGLHDQEQVLRGEAERRGWEMEIVRDAGASGSTLERPGLRRATEILARREADGLMVAKLDRLSRSVWTSRNSWSGCRTAASRWSCSISASTPARPAARSWRM
jgi:DNA invertase Pin-like site-specific DNA recombinase